MKLVTFESRQDLAAGQRLGAIDSEGDVVDLMAAATAAGHSHTEFLSSMLALIDGGDAALEAAQRAFDAVRASDRFANLYAPDAVRLFAPLPNPRRLRDCGCFLQHFRNARAVRYRRLAAREADPQAAMERFRAAGDLDIPAAWTEVPVMLNANHLSIIGGDTDIVWPHGAQRLDYELEFAMVTGRGRRNIARESAAGHVFGFTIFNDVSARDIQARDIAAQTGLGGRSKDFDSGNVIGPCIVTVDEIGDPYDLTMTARVNGEEWSRGNTGQMDHRFEDVLVHASRNQTVHAGEIFGSGTVPTGCGLEHDRYFTDGDTVELEIEKIGVLRNRVVKPADWQDSW
jgi:2-keto-4-pentenoate hydratase/2-oxohepta-3-ene-1,7-dioic acid hydratase in catechol pathway